MCFVPLQPLTPAERRVLALILEGQTNRELAATLGISRRTAEHHVTHVLAKIGFSRRTRHLAHYPAPSRTPARSGQ